MATLQRDDVLKLARLARLTLTDVELEAYLVELNAILEYVVQLDAVDVDGLEPTNQVSGNTNIMREDTVIDYGAAPHALLKLAPATQDSQLKVKRMIQ